MNFDKISFIGKVNPWQENKDKSTKSGNWKWLKTRKSVW